MAPRNAGPFLCERVRSPVSEPVEKGPGSFTGHEEFVRKRQGGLYQQLAGKIVLDLFYGSEVDQVLSVEPEELLFRQKALHLFQRIVDGIFLFVEAHDKCGFIADVKEGDA